MDIADGTNGQALVAELRHTLQHLYDPAELTKSDLVRWLHLDKHQNRVSALRRTLVNAIQALKPGASVPMHSNAWRLYHVLLWRYVEQSRQNDVAANLAVSPRQLRRLEREAVQMLVDYLQSRYEISVPSDQDGDASSSASEAKVQHATETPDREQELLWLEASFPSEMAEIGDLIAAILKTVEPLAQTSNTIISCETPDNLPSVMGQIAALRQALVNLLTAAIHAVPGGHVKITVETDQRNIVTSVQGIPCTESALPTEAEIADRIEMARRFIDLFGGSIALYSEHAGTTPVSVQVTLPVADQIPVLCIDDNADTLQLLRRYLAGTTYRFIGTRQPEQAIELAQEIAPQIIVLDIMLPDIDGWEMLGRLREHPQLKGIPILVCTILPQDKLALTLGAAGFVRKPVNRESLLEALNHQLAQQGSC